MFSDDCPPPLDDFSEILLAKKKQQPKHQQQQKSTLKLNLNTTTIETTKPIKKTTGSLLDFGTQKDSRFLVNEQTEVHPTTTTTTSPPPKPSVVVKQEPKKFGSGLKGGFLNSSPAAPKQKKKVVIEEIPIIKPKTKTKSNPLILNELQKELTNSPFSLSSRQNEWLTPQLLEKIEKNPILSKAFNNPLFATACSKIAENSTGEYMTRLEKEHPDLVLGLKEFVKFMGEEFKEVSKRVGEKQDEEGVVDEMLSAEEQKLVKKVTSRGREIKDIMGDGRVQKLFKYLQQGEDAHAMGYMNSDPELKRMVSVLIDCGLLKLK